MIESEHTSRKFLRECKDLLGESKMLKLFGKASRTFSSWIADQNADPNNIRKNPLESYENLLVMLVDSGNSDLARSIISSHANIINCELRGKGSVTPDKITIEDECLDDYPALINLHDAIRSNKNIRTVEHLGLGAREEIRETVERYRTIL